MNEILGSVLLGSCVSRVASHPVYFRGPTVSRESVDAAIDRLTKNNLIICYKKEFSVTHDAVALHFDGEITDTAIDLLTRYETFSDLSPGCLHHHQQRWQGGYRKY